MTELYAPVDQGLGDRVFEWLRTARMLGPRALALGRCARAGAVLRQMASLPMGSLRDIVGDGAPLVVAPHPDDESLGCGGLISEASAQGRQPVIAVVTDGSMSHPNSRTHPPPVMAALRQQETRAAAAELGVCPERVHFLGLPDGRAPRRGPEAGQAAERLVELARSAGATAILVSWEHDPHPDHTASEAIARRAARRAGLRLVRYPVWGWTLPPERRLPVGRVHGRRLAMGGHLPAKRRAILAHVSQHTGLITDDPRGFTLPERLLTALDQPWEAFLFDRARG
jgi:LmbE family N-acetylglucosaminyl deacetylase